MEATEINGKYDLKYDLEKQYSSKESSAFKDLILRVWFLKSNPLNS